MTNRPRGLARVRLVRVCLHGRKWERPRGRAPNVRTPCAQTRHPRCWSAARARGRFGSGPTMRQSRPGRPESARRARAGRGRRHPRALRPHPAPPRASDRVDPCALSVDSLRLGRRVRRLRSSARTAAASTIVSAMATRSRGPPRPSARRCNERSTSAHFWRRLPRRCTAAGATMREPPPCN